MTLDCAGSKIQVQRETADFTQAWARSNGSRCEVPYVNGGRAKVPPVTDLEKAAYAASGYDGNDVATLYGICAAVRPDDPHLNGVDVMSAAQAAEVQGALMLCPSHPLAAQYLDAIDKAVNPDRQDELPVYGGKYAVGTDIPAGTYKTTDTQWDACYWARVKGDGTIIENNLVTFAPDGITVTLHDGEGFQSDGCGTWLKVG